MASHCSGPVSNSLTALTDLPRLTCQPQSWAIMIGQFLSIISLQHMKLASKHGTQIIPPFLSLWSNRQTGLKLIANWCAWIETVYCGQREWVGYLWMSERELASHLSGQLSLWQCNAMNNLAPIPSINDNITTKQVCNYSLHQAKLGHSSLYKFVCSCVFLLLLLWSIMVQTLQPLLVLLKPMNTPPISLLMRWYCTNIIIWICKTTFFFHIFCFFFQFRF